MAVNRSPGHHAGLSRQAILRAAVRLADREGLPALSMRRLGTELGVEAMALYHHIPNKNALLDGMVERVAAEASPPDFDASSWRDGLRDYAHSLLRALQAHPNLVSLFMSRPAMTPRNLRSVEAMMGSLRAAGFDGRQALDVVYSLAGFVLGHAAVQTGAGEDEETDSVGAVGADPDGEGDRTARLSDIASDTYPLLAGAARAGGRCGARSRFDFAVEALLTGFDAARGERGPRQPDRR